MNTNFEIPLDVSNPTFDLVRDVLQANGGTGIKESDSCTLFTTDAIKAPFSYHKPVRWAEHYPAITGNNAYEYLKSYNGHYGFNIDGARATDFEALVNIYENPNNDGMNGWVYEPPTGGTFPYRIDDFRGYYAKAQPMTNGFSIPDTVYKIHNTAKAWSSLSPSDGRSLEWKHFTDGERVLSNYYFGVVIYKDINDCRGGTAVKALGDQSVSEGGSLDVEFKTDWMALNIEYKAYPFISSHPMAWGTVLSSGQQLFTIPLLQGMPIKCLSTNVSVMVSTKRIVTSQKIYVEFNITITNVSGEELTLTNNNINIYRTSIYEEGVTNLNRGTLIVPKDASGYSIWSGTIEVNQLLYFEKIPQEQWGFMPLIFEVTLNGGSTLDKTFPVLPTGDIPK
jgi:hypothetical protein